MEPISKGLLSGLAYGLLLGPMFFMSIRTTLSTGLKHGIALVSGAFSSDLTLVIFSWWSAGKLAAITSESLFQSWFGLICGLLLFGFGLSAVWTRNHRFDKQLNENQPVAKRRHAFLQGFTVNMTNPSNWLFWLGVATAAKADSPAGDPYYMRFFMGAALIGLFSTDLAKVALAHQIGQRLKPGVPEKIVRVAGFILMGVSSWILFRVVQNAF